MCLIGAHSGSRCACASANFRLPLSLKASICGCCGTLKCQCRLQNDSEHTSSSDMSSERSSLQDQQCAYKKDCEAKATLAFRITVDVWTPLFDVELSHKKALRAAMLKIRFADTIFKACQKTLLDHGDKPDPAKMQQEKEDLKGNNVKRKPESKHKSEQAKLPGKGKQKLN